MAKSQNYDTHIEAVDTQIASIISRAISYMWEMEESEVRESILQAYDFAKSAHEHDTRLSWEPYISHPVAATQILLSLSPDIETIQACLLHDVIEDTEYTYEDILEIFGQDVARLCSGMSKLEKVRYRGEERAIGSLRKMFVAMAEDIRVIFIKLSDRLHNMQTLHYHPKPEKQKRIAEETLNIYSPIAWRLGLYTLKNDLENECFKILYHDEYETLIEHLKELSESRKEFQNSAILEIQKLLSSVDIAHKVDFRVKSPYSIYKKMQRKGISHPADLYDIYGVRIIVPSIADCYRVLGEIHSKWHTLPYRFKDYIALPKPNGYQSLHTTIVWFLKNFTAQPTELQIRTEDMHVRSEIGVAAHFEYKEKGSKIATEIDWVSDLRDAAWQEGGKDLLDSLRGDTFRNRIFIFTPRGDLVNLPVWSTPIDFAYQVHTDLGNHISIAKVNSQVHPLDKELSNGDIVEVIIDKNRKPSPFWLGFVKTIKAKNNIKSYLHKGDKELHRDRGKEIINKYLEKSGLSLLDKDLTVLKNIDERELNIEERLQLLEQVGNFSITPASLLRRIMRSLKIPYHKKSSSQNGETLSGASTQSSQSDHKEIIIWGEENIPYKQCRSCCAHGIPESIVAHINSRGHFTIHARTCRVLNGVNKDRLMNAFVKWEEYQSRFSISLTVDNIPWMFKSVSEVLYAMEINIDEIHTRKRSSSATEIVFSLEIPDYEYLLIDRFLERVKIVLWKGLHDYQLQKIDI